MGNVLVAIFALFLIIFVHEAGHFLAAKLLGLPVVSFSVGFGKAIWKRRIGESLYALRVFPFGGSVRFLEPDGKKSDFEKVRQERGKLLSVLFPLEKEEVILATEISARTTKLGQRRRALRALCVLVSGPLANIALAVFICVAYVLAYGVGDKLESLSVTWVAPGGPAGAAGFRVGDSVVAINGTPVSSHREFTSLLSSRMSKPILYKVKRASSGEVFEASFGAERKKTAKGGTFPDPGFRYKLAPLTVQDILHVVNAAIVEPAMEFLAILPVLPDDLANSSNVRGPIGAVSFFSESVGKGLLDFLVLLVSLNLIVGLLNLLPVPPLDGWEVVMVSFQLLLGRVVAENYQRAIARVSMSFFLVLSIYLLGKDIVDLIK